MVFYYLFSAFILTASVTPKNTILNNSYVSRFHFVIFASVLAFVVGTRNIAGDTERYVRDVIVYTNMSFFDAVYVNSREFIFFLIQWTSSNFPMEKEVFLVSIYIIFITILYMGLKKFFNSREFVFVFFTYINFYFLYGYLFVAIRQGLAIAFIILALGFLIQGKNYKYLISVLIATQFHLTGLIGFLILIFTHKKVKLEHLIYIWIVACILLLTRIADKVIVQYFNLGIFLNKIEFFSSESAIENYASGTHRIDFLVFSGFWIIVGITMYKKLFEIDQVYIKILKSYIGLNIIFVLLGFVAYSDRIATYSWMLVPLLIWYPIFRMKNYRKITFGISLVIFILGYFTGISRYYL